MRQQIASTAEAAQQKQVQVPGGTLAYDVAGTGPVVLCLPGIGDTRRVYERFAPALLQAGYRVMTTDLRGNGRSAGRFPSHTLQDLATDIAAILDAEGVRQAYLAAGSLSGAAAGLFATRAPDRVLGLILFSPVFYTPGRLLIELSAAGVRLPGVGAAVWGMYFKTLYPKRPLDAAYLAHVKANLRQPGAVRSLVDMLRTPHLDGATRQITVPTLIFFGTKDPDFKDVRAEAAMVQAAIPQARIHLLEGFGHYPQREAADLVLPDTLAWLATSQ